MDIVAITDLATSLEVEAPLLARELGTTAYDARQKLAVGLPCVVLMTTDRSRTLALLASLRGRGHGAVACESKAVVASGSMLAVRRFHIDEDALVLEGRGAGGEAAAAPAPDVRVPYAEMIALVLASHRHSFESHDEKKETKFRPVAALASGGVILTKTVKRDVVRTNEDREQVIYIFRRRQPACLLREAVAQYGGLGEAVRPTRIENFQTTLRLLRANATAVPFDDRLVGVKRFPEPPNDPGAPRAFDAETGGVDLLAHLVAMRIAR